MAPTPGHDTSKAETDRKVEALMRSGAISRRHAKRLRGEEEHEGRSRKTEYRSGYRHRPDEEQQ